MKNKIDKVIWILNHYAITPEFPGGTRHYELALRLSDIGYKVVIFASSVLHQNSSISILKNKQKIKIIDINNNFKFTWIKAITYKGNNIRRMLNMFSFIYNIYSNYRMLIKKNKLQTPDLIVGSTVHPIVPLLGKHIAKKLKAKYVFEIRDLWPKSFIDLGIWKQNSIISKFFYSIEKYSLIDAYSIVILSPLTKQYLMEKYNVSETAIYYVPNGISLKKSSNFGSETAEQIKSTGKFNLVFTGSIIVSNKVDLICNTANNLIEDSEICFHIIGNGQEKAYLMNKYASLKNIKWYDFVPKNEVQCVLNAADALLLIQGNVAWGSSNKLYDYLAAGKPIISSVWVTHNDIVEKIYAGLSVKADDSIKLKEAILKLKQLSIQKRITMGENAIKYVKQNHDWDLLAKKFEKVIQSE